MIRGVLAAAIMLALPCDLGLAQDKDGRSRGFWGARQAPVESRSGTRQFEDPSVAMLDQAQSELAHGRPAEGRRLLEMVIERFPATWAADEARVVLSRKFGVEVRAASGAPAQIAPPATAPKPNDAAFAASRPFPGPPASSAPPRGESRHLKALGHDFRSSVGDRVFFADGSADLGAKSRVVLAAQAAWLKRYPSLAITIEGHADDRGAATVNDDIARRRAEAVRARLIDEGLEEARIRVRAVGRQRPVAPCQEDACAVQNRRVVTVISELQASAPVYGTQPLAPVRLEGGGRRE